MDKTTMAAALFDKRATEYQERFMNQEGYHDTFDFFCRHIPQKQPQILDVACGPGNISCYLLQQRPDFRITGIDLAPNMLILAEKNNPGADFLQLDARRISDMNRTWEGIICGFCLPYLSKEETRQLIKDAAAVLSPGGIFYISTMEDEEDKSGLTRSAAGDELYMYYHRADYLSAYLEESGFEMLWLVRKVFPGNDGALTTDLIIISRKRN
ncbi:methyltransferase domain-containing protein [Chitinophaga sp. Mgbs1]|uniref:Methyltransferase domain-containing protein n=1 Tax=Chitinophaga solisilvae TaxID=1233460 RepID=A0A433WFV6_9BACT|nr:methyltransferase domain-containing protein [Chitinophaga solisilvae]